MSPGASINVSTSTNLEQFWVKYPFKKNCKQHKVLCFSVYTKKQLFLSTLAKQMHFSQTCGERNMTFFFFFSEPVLKTSMGEGPKIKLSVLMSRSILFFCDLWGRITLTFFLKTRVQFLNLVCPLWRRSRRLEGTHQTLLDWSICFVSNSVLLASKFARILYTWNLAPDPCPPSFVSCICSLLAREWFHSARLCAKKFLANVVLI